MRNVNVPLALTKEVELAKITNSNKHDNANLHYNVLVHGLVSCIMTYTDNELQICPFLIVNVCYRP